ncbi:MAG TPA: MFS transporter [Pilimelia sp.]|nr:MFS transporter [Pilimelia sp.]
MPEPATTATDPVEPETVDIQRRTVRLLVVSQILGGIGVGFGVAVGALLAARLGGIAVSGLAGSAAVVGGALLTIPVTRLIGARGRRPGLVLAYGTGLLGALVVVLAAAVDSVALLLAGMALFGGGSAAGLQARYAAVDLARPARRGRQLSLVVWATTVGAVLAPTLAAPTDALAGRAGLPLLSGPFVFSAAAFALAAGLLWLFLRPDPLLTARRLAGADAAPQPGRGGVRSALPAVLASPPARLGVGAVAVGHLVMVGVMSMTPVHVGESLPHADALRVVGIVISLHIAGMYALSPLVGWLTDRFGRRPLILAGLAVLALACAVAGTAGHDPVRLAVGLTLLGLGWSGTMVAGSTLLSESVPTPVRHAAQGLGDLTMGLAGAAAGAVSGWVVQAAGFPTLNLAAALATVPLAVLAVALRSPGRGPGGPGPVVPAGGEPALPPVSPVADPVAAASAADPAGVAPGADPVTAVKGERGAAD